MANARSTCAVCSLKTKHRCNRYCLSHVLPSTTVQHLLLQHKVMERDQDHSPLWRDWDDGRPNSHGLVSEWSILPFSSRLALFCAILRRMVTHYIALNQNLLCFSVILITFILIYLISVIYLFIKSILPPPCPPFKSIPDCNDILRLSEGQTIQIRSSKNYYKPAMIIRLSEILWGITQKNVKRAPPRLRFNCDSL